MGKPQLKEHSEDWFGVGSMPDSLDRVNWGAFFFGWLWAAAYGAWPWFVLLFGYSFSSRYIIEVADAVLDGLPPAVAAFIALGTWGLPALFCVRANRLVWRYQHERLEGVSRPAVGRPAADVDQYLRSQRVWTWVGVAFFAALIVSSAPWEVLDGTWTQIPPIQVNNLVALGMTAVLLIRDRLVSAKLTSASS